MSNNQIPSSQGHVKIRGEATKPCDLKRNPKKCTGAKRGTRVPAPECSIMLTTIQLERLRSVVGTAHLLHERQDCLLYAYDATAMMKQTPAAVVFPANGEEVAALVACANELGCALVARGSGTGLSGGSVPLENSVVVCLQRLNRILEIDAENLMALVEPGVITAHLHEHVEARGLFYPPDPGSMKICTLGGNVAENAGGLRGLKYGVTRDYVMGLEVVLPTGETMWTGGKCCKDVAGYDLRQILIGSEGTLGIFTKLLLKLVPKPAAKSTLLASFPTMQHAAATVAAIIAAPVIPATLEFLDQTTLRCVEEYAHIGLPTDAGAILLMESDGHPVVAREEADLMARLAEANQGHVRRAASPAEALELSSARRMAFPALARLRPTTVLEDVSVPRSRLVDMVSRVEQIAREEQLLIGTFGHAGDGNLHPTILLDERDAQEVARMHRAFEKIVLSALELGGCLTGEHGVGLLKRDFLERFLPAPNLATMRCFRESLDPRSVMNPGKMFSPRPRREGQLPTTAEQCGAIMDGLRP